MALQTDVPGIDWPSIPGRRAAALMAMQFQLAQSQWLPWEELRKSQFHQLARVVHHAIESVPFYRGKLKVLRGTTDPAALEQVWDSLPILTRAEVQAAGTKLHSSEVPKSHGQVHTLLTSGSTGQPVQCLGTQITRFFWHCITLRDHLWHKRDFSRKLAAIRYTDSAAAPPDGIFHNTWGPPVEELYESGPSTLLTTDSTVSQQADWLRSHQPAYLIAYPSNIKSLARHFWKRDWHLPSLIHIRSFGEILEEEVRHLCAQAWEVPIIDCYSSQEVGYVALECPDCPHTYHVQSECALVEILDEDDKPCSTGEIGRVIVTPLHNAAMPLIRYDLGDYAEVAPPCRCGRGLPALKRIVGRQRNMLTLPTGEQRWPGLGRGDVLERLPEIHQFQLAQVSLERIEVRLVQQQAFSVEQEHRIVDFIRHALGHPFDVQVVYVEQIARSSNGKFEEFLSEL